MAGLDGFQMRLFARMMELDSLREMWASEAAQGQGVTANDINNTVRARTLEQLHEYEAEDAGWAKALEEHERGRL